MNRIAALLEQGRYLAAQTDAFPSTTETVEALNHAQEGIEEVAKNPGIIRTWLEGLVPDLLNFAFQVLIALLVYVIGGRIIKWITKLVRRSMNRAGTDEGVKQFMIPVIKYSLYVVLIFIIMGLFGIATTSAVAVLGSAGVAVGLALQGSLSNFAGGVLILLLKPFKVGDLYFLYQTSYRGQQADCDTERYTFQQQSYQRDKQRQTSCGSRGGHRL